MSVAREKLRSWIMAASKVNRRSMASFNYWQAPQAVASLHSTLQRCSEGALIAYSACVAGE
jgi:hypothetical protein